MKYIRTKDGRILEWEKLSEITKLSIDTCEETIKEADTIEELCDIFIVEHEESNPIFFPEFGLLKLHFIKYHEGDELLGVKARYGAIWTNKGLLYVAKINDKGEFELL